MVQQHKFYLRINALPLDTSWKKLNFGWRRMISEFEKDSISFIMISSEIFLQNTINHKCILFLERILSFLYTFCGVSEMFEKFESKTFRFRLKERILEKMKKKKAKNGKEAHFRLKHVICFVRVNPLGSPYIANRCRWMKRRWKNKRKILYVLFTKFDRVSYWKWKQLHAFI